MRHGGWKSSTVTEGDVETSMESKKQIAGQIMGDQNASLNKVQKVSHESSSSMIDITSTSPGVKLEHCYSCTIILQSIRINELTFYGLI